MFKEITLTFLEELKELVMEDKVKNLSITKESDKYMAEYSISENTVGSDIKNISKLLSELQLFSTALLLNKVEKLELHYNPSKNLFVVNSEYEMSVNEDNYLDKIKILSDSIDRVISLSRDLELDVVKIDNLYEKMESNNNNKKIRYVQTTVKECLKSLVKVLG